MLPLHPQPLPGEILSSWMVRLAFANNFKLHTFYSGLVQYKRPIWNRDIDRRPPAELINILHEHTGQPISRLNQMALESFNGMLFDSDTPSTNSPWILFLGIFHRTHLRSGMQFCPICLKEGAAPYYRLNWRLAFYVMCPIHGCQMLENCPRCSSPISYQRHGIGRDRVIREDALAHCSECGFDLRNANAISIVHIDRESEQMLINIIAAGSGFYAQGNEGIFSANVLFFKGMYTLLNLLHGRFSYRLVMPLAAISGVDCPDYSQSSRSEFERKSIAMRLELMKMVSWLMVDWPEHFLTVCEVSGMTRSRICENIKSLPYWLAEVSNVHLDKRIYIPSSIEVAAACTYLRSCGEKITARSIAKTLGITQNMGLNLRHYVGNL